MSDLRVFAKQQNVGRDASGWVAQRAFQDGAAVVVPWIQSLVMEGYAFSTQFGAADKDDSDVGTFGAGGVDLTEFDFLQTLPAAGTVGIIPIFWKPVFEAIGTIAAVDAVLLWGSGGVKHASGITPTASNMRPDSANSSACTLSALSDTGGTGITIGGEIYREGGTHLTGVAGTGQTFMPEWSINKTGYAPVIVGASRQVAAFASGQASTGFMIYQWVEMPDEYFN